MSKPLVLVVDDSEICRLVASGMLEHLNCIVHLANDGLEAIKRCNEIEFDIVFMDCQMPNMTGYEAAKIIRGRGTRVKICALTTNDLEENKIECTEAGMDSFLSKPVCMEDFRRILFNNGILEKNKQTSV